VCHRQNLDDAKVVRGLADLYVTTAAYRLSAGQLKWEPHAGATFVCRPGAAGLPASSFAG